MVITNERIYYNEHEIFIIPSRNNNYYLLYCPTLKKLFRVNTTLANELSKNSFQNHGSEINVKKLKASLDRALPFSIIPFPNKKYNSKYFHLAVGLTQNCTLKCLYCHAEAGKNNDMDICLLDHSLDYAYNTAKKKSLKGINISFAVGGEPTTNWTLFKKCIDKINLLKNLNYKLRIHTSMTTNGYYGLSKRKFISDNIDGILISLDGFEEIQNLHRPSRYGKDTFQTVSKSVNYFLKNHSNISLRATISNFSVTKMVQIVESFYSFFGNNYHLVFEPLVLLGRAIENKGIVSEPNGEDFITNFIQARNCAENLGITLRTSADNSQRLVRSFCGAMSIPSFSVTTNGKVTTCERDSEGRDYSYGFFDFTNNCFVFYDELINKNKEYSILPEKCDSCFCKYHCAGDCPDIRSHLDYDRCDVVKALTLDSIEKNLKIKKQKKGGE